MEQAEMRAQFRAALNEGLVSEQVSFDDGATVDRIADRLFEEFVGVARPQTRLTAFLFRLMRDNVPTGIVEEHVRVVEVAHSPDGVADFLGAHGVALYAQELAQRLVPS